jgi:RNA polymerase sigma-70 factor (sigma-E family)
LVRDDDAQVDVSSDGTADADGFAAFVRTRWTPLVRLAYAVTGDVARAEDAVQEGLAKLWPRWHRLRDENPYGYARRVVVNEALTAGRRRWRRQELLTDRPPDRAASHGDERVEDRDALRAALSTLPPRQRAVVVLRFVEDLGEAEVAQILGCSVGTVKSHASRGLAALRAAHAPSDALPVKELP